MKKICSHNKNISTLPVGLLFFVMSMVLCIPVKGQTRDCPYCKGNGTVVKTITVSQFGVRKEAKVKCSTCGGYYYPSSGHTHVRCSHCGGSGKLRSSGSSNSAYNPESPEAIWGQQIAVNIRYGIPVSDQETAAFKNFAAINPEQAKLYIAWRNTLNGMAIYCNQCSAMLTMTPVASLDKMFVDTENRLSAYVQQISLPQDLLNIAQQVYLQYKNVYLSYRKYSAAQEALTNLKNNLINWQLQQNLFP